MLLAVWHMLLVIMIHFGKTHMKKLYGGVIDQNNVFGSKYGCPRNELFILHCPHVLVLRKILLLRIHFNEKKKRLIHSIRYSRHFYRNYSLSPWFFINYHLSAKCVWRLFSRINTSRVEISKITRKNI